MIAMPAKMATSAQWDQAPPDHAHLAHLATTFSSTGTAIFARLANISPQDRARIAQLTTTAHLESYIHSSARQATKAQD